MLPWVMKPRSEYKILLAGVPVSYQRLRNILRGYDAHFVDTLAAAKIALQSFKPDLALLGVHFDESNMFELLRFIKDGEHSDVPIICYRATLGAETRSKITMQALDIASRASGASAFIDLFDFKTEEAGNSVFLSLVDRVCSEQRVKQDC
jgi:CheY-like chemotaxis protein